ncbi:hypothetical protein D7Y13_40145 [Corallococcus praedator]|uniref:Lipoprotein n=1 Tax=Corallococcus praedator TaxID=2316724 RepID=A0ABX9Q4K3_9BACT|nr:MULTISPECIES: hypothetical protein [Corallococcus]RKG97713.1 hypothetical protein D7X74_40740 [Corallococcus sp. CA047B]RKH34451.1 hypothetical protein D7X75_08375 [Corallococcus sp. CA031C]RKH90072.1 hypothetical protein D7Y13_40145 [Corallococcus praedator]
MPRPSRSLSFLMPLLAVVSVGCASATRMSPEDRASLDRSLSGPDAEQYLRVSSYLTPFFGDASKRLLTPYPPEDVRLLDDTSGRPISPGAIQATVPAGTRVRITKVEFPTAWVVTERVLYTPRSWPWVYVTVEGAPAGEQVVLVLPPNLDRPDAFRTELEKTLTPHSLKDQLAGFSAAVQEAVRTKKLVADMPADALRMAWGPPETVRRSLEGTARNEEWRYAGERRKAFLTDGRLVRAEEAGTSLLP